MQINFNKLKKYKSEIGASLMEIILVLGIMAVLTPVAMKFAFKDLGDVKYLNIAKQLKQVLKSLSAYASTERDNWAVGSGIVSVNNLDSYNLTDTIDEEIVDNLTMKYVKTADDKVNFYGVIKMNSFPLEELSFRKTLMYVGDNVGYVIAGEKCGTCTSNTCVCSINGDWGIDYSEVSSVAFKNGDLVAVLMVDDNLLEDEFSSKLYLYRNSQGGTDGNVMKRSLIMGNFDIKNIKDIFVNYLFGKTDEEALLEVKATTGNFSGPVNILNAIILGEEAGITFSNSASIFVPEVNFFASSLLGEFSAPNAVLKKSVSTSSYRPKLNVETEASFDKVEVQNLKFRNEANTALNVSGYETTGTADSKLKVETPNLRVSGTLSAKIVNVNNKQIRSGDSGVYTSGGKIIFSNASPNVVVYNIKGSSGSVSLFSKISEFSSRVSQVNNYLNTTIW